MTKKTALVTGASSGIGRAIVYELLADGLDVYAAARNEQSIFELKEKGARTIRLDVTDNNSMESAFRMIESESGGVDVLVNNAGYGHYGAIEDVSMTEARVQMETNVFGMARLIQLVLPGMRKKGRGKIVNISSMGGKMGFAFGGWYHASKHAVEGLSDALRQEVAPFGIDVIVIEPGPIRTPWIDVSAENLRKHSAEGPYAKDSRIMAEFLKAPYRNRMSTGPEAVSKIISRALKSKHSLPRYRAGWTASFMITLRWLLSDRGFDNMVKSQLKAISKRLEKSKEVA